jgi:hypothetical protein
MDRSPLDRILVAWDEVADRAVPPASAPRRTWGWQSLGFSGLLPLAAAGLAVAVAIAWGGGRLGGGPGAGDPSQSAGSLVTPSVPPPTASASAGGSVSPSDGAACDPDRLRAEVTAWEGAAGTRIAHLTLSLEAEGACTIARLWRPELVDGGGTIRIEGPVPVDVGTMEIRSGKPLTTLVAAGNDCLPPPTSPVSVAFILDDGSRLVAAPLGAGDLTTPPCLGAGEPASISMQPWSP